MLGPMQIIWILLSVLTYTQAVKPPGYVETPKTPDPNPPKYSYEYKIGDSTGGAQGKEEKRDGIYAAGRYYIQQKEANQDVRYFADDWGYHPVVEYSNSGPHSRANAKFALGHEAVQQLRNKENNLPQLQGLPETGNLEKQDDHSQPPQPQILQNNPNAVAQQTAPSDQSNIINSQYIQLPSLVEDPKNTQLGDHQPIADTQGQVNPLLLGERFSHPNTEQEPRQEFLLQNYAQPEQQQQIFIQHIIQPEQHQQQILIQPGNTKPLSQDNPVQIEMQHNEKGTQHPEQNQLKSEQILVEYKEPLQKIIFPQQSSYLLVQPNAAQNSHRLQPIENILIQNQVQIEKQPNKEQQTLTLYERGGNIIQPQPLIQLSDGNSGENDETNLIKFQTFGLKIKDDEIKKQNKLIESTKHLVNGEDVLNINGAVAGSDATIESTTATTSITDLISGNTVSTTLDDTTYFTTTVPSVTATESSLQVKPIVAADVQENHPSTTYEVREQENYSSTANSIETVSETFQTSSPSTIIVTPRPVSTKFLAPITAGIRLEGGKKHTIKHSEHDHYNIQIQKTIPYYYGKYEFPIEYDQHYGDNKSRVMQDIELGKSLLMFSEFPVRQSQQLVQQLPNIKINRPFLEQDEKINIQQLPQIGIKDNFIDIDQQQSQQYQHQIAIQQTQKNNVKQQSTVNSHIYPVKVSYDVKYPIVKQVEVPVKVERIVEKPVHITKYVEKPVPVPQPYPVEKIVERPVHVPVQVTKYVDRPYPVEIRVPYPQPYPVEKVVQKIVKQPYPVEVRVPVQVEKVVEKKIQVPHYIDRPYPVEVKVPVLQPYYVEVNRPYQVQSRHYSPANAQQNSLYPTKASATLIQIPVHNHNEQYAQQSQQLAYVFHNPYAYAPHINQYLPPNRNIQLNNGHMPPQQENNGYLPPPPTHDCQGQQSADANIRNVHYAKLEDNVGLLPPKFGVQNHMRTFRNARSNFDDSSIRMEYGFKPPLIPSPEIDEQGRPIEKSDK